MTSNQEDKIISEFLESIGPWRDFVVIGGGFALFIYKLYLSDPKMKGAESCVSRDLGRSAEDF